MLRGSQIIVSSGPRDDAFLRNFATSYTLETLRMESAMDSQFYIGRRLSYDSQLCTVRYIGEVTGTKSGTWLGVEWDDPTRGKHTGEHNGVKYFECMCFDWLPPKLMY